MKKRGYVVRAFDPETGELNPDILVEGMDDICTDLSKIVAQLHELDFHLLVVAMWNMEKIIEQTIPGTTALADALEKQIDIAWAVTKIPVKRKPEQED